MNEKSIEQLTAEFMTADEEFARLAAKAAQANLEFNARKLSAPSLSEFARLRDTADQSVLRRDPAKQVRDKKRAALDVAIEIQARRDRADALAKELAAGEQKLAEMDATIRAARAELSRLMTALPELERDRNLHLRHLAALKQAAVNAVAA